MKRTPKIKTLQAFLPWQWQILALDSIGRNFADNPVSSITQKSTDGDLGSSNRCFADDSVSSNNSVPSITKKFTDYVLCSIYRWFTKIFWLSLLRIVNNWYPMKAGLKFWQELQGFLIVRLHLNIIWGRFEAIVRPIAQQSLHRWSYFEATRDSPCQWTKRMILPRSAWTNPVR